VERKRYARKFQRMAVARMETCEDVGELAREPNFVCHFKGSLHFVQVLSNAIERLKGHLRLLTRNGSSEQWFRNWLGLTLSLQVS